MPSEVKQRAAWIWKSVLRLISVTLCLSAGHSVTWTQDLLVPLSTASHVLNISVNSLQSVHLNQIDEEFMNSLNVKSHLTDFCTVQLLHLCDFPHFLNLFLCAFLSFFLPLANEIKF